MTVPTLSVYVNDKGRIVLRLASSAELSAPAKPTHRPVFQAGASGSPAKAIARRVLVQDMLEEENPDLYRKMQMEGTLTEYVKGNARR